MVEYKWVALSNTTVGVLMASVNATVVMVSLPAIFRGIGINPVNPSSFQYLLWILMGYSIVTAAFLVTFGRLSDIYGRVRLYNLGFAIFTVGAILLSLTPSRGDAGALEIIAFRIVQAVGGGFLFANSAAIITDAFPPNERGKALGINQIAGLAGSLVGLVLGGVLATANWRYVFLVSVPFGLFGTAWSYLKLREVGAINRDQKIDYAGNTTFALGLTLLLLGVTYGLQPYGSSPYGWGDPWVVAAISVGGALLAVFPFVERRVREPMFRLELFGIRQFAAGTLSQFFAAIGFGGVQILVIILLQGIWLPLHGYSYESTPFWAGVYTLPMAAGFVIMGPLSGALSDRYGSRFLTTLGLTVVASCFVALSTLPYDFTYAEFAVILFAMGVGNGMFAAPNTAAIMNSVPREHRGAASGMRSTLQNTAQTASLAVFFTIVIGALTSTLPGTLSQAVAQAGAPQLAPIVSKIPVTGALFSAFLGYNPVGALLAALPPQLAQTLSPQAVATLTSRYWFPETIAGPFASAIHTSFHIGAALTALAAALSALRGKAYIAELEEERAAEAAQAAQNGPKGVVGHK